MKRLAIFFILFGCTSHANQVSNYSTAPSACEHTRDQFSCVRYLGNYDADTITVSIPKVHPLLGEKISVRVLGIDAPEIKGRDTCEKEAALKARDLASNLLKSAQRIDLVNIGRDKYFRVLADVTVDHRSLGKILINERLAVPYDGGHKDRVSWCGTNGQ